MFDGNECTGSYIACIFQWPRILTDISFNVYKIRMKIKHTYTRETNKMKKKSKRLFDEIIRYVERGTSHLAQRIDTFTCELIKHKKCRANKRNTETEQKKNATKKKRNRSYHSMSHESSTTIKRQQCCMWICRVMVVVDCMNQCHSVVAYARHV